MAIDYARAEKNGPKLKAALTRARKRDFDAVLKACKAAVKEWGIWGAWPDDWRIWQNALEESANKYHRETGIFVNVPPLQDLVLEILNEEK